MNSRLHCLQRLSGVLFCLRTGEGPSWYYHRRVEEELKLLGEKDLMDEFLALLLAGLEEFERRIDQRIEEEKRR